MSKQVNALLEKLRAGAVTGMEKNPWFSPIEENKGVELFGTVTRIFEYEYRDPSTKRAETRRAMTIQLAEDVSFTLAKDGETEQVHVASGEKVIIPLSGQLGYFVESENVGPGTIVYLRYEGKDKTKTIRGNHPHLWTRNFLNPDTGEVDN